MAGLVIDASAVLTSVLAEQALDESNWPDLLRDSRGVVPAHFPAEYSNTLVMAVRRSRISDSQRQESLKEIAGWPLDIEPALDWRGMERVSRLAQEHRLTVHDAIYLDLAVRTRLPLATYDTALIEAARTAGVVRAT